LAEYGLSRPRRRQDGGGGWGAIGILGVSIFAVAVIAVGAVVYFSLPDQDEMYFLYLKYKLTKYNIEDSERLYSGLKDTLGKDAWREHEDDIKRKKKKLAELDTTSKERFGCPAQELFFKLNAKNREDVHAAILEYLKGR
jgi:hypothetical protein